MRRDLRIDPTDEQLENIEDELYIDQLIDIDSSNNNYTEDFNDLSLSDIQSSY